MSKKKDKKKKNGLTHLRKKINGNLPSISGGSILLGFAGGAVLSGLVFAGIRAGIYKDLRKALKR